ncbi:MAG: hypothetical protein R3E09_00095 [Novosphingobium sp.]
MPESLFYGYDHQARQPCACVHQQIRLGTLADTMQIDAWLRDHFAIDEKAFADAEEKPDDADLALAGSIVRRALVLYGELLRAAGVPSFDRGKVIRLEVAKDEQRTMTALVALPVIDGLRLHNFTRLLGHICNLVLNGLSLKPTAQGAATLLAELDRSVVKPLRKLAAFGGSTLPICELAFQQNIPFRHVGGGVIRLGWGARSNLFHRAAIESDSLIGGAIAGSKQHTAQILGLAGLPVPEHILVGSADAAVNAGRQLGWPLVVKPSNRERSVGVTIGIESEQALVAAFEQARKVSDRILVERQIPGTCHRIMVAKGKVVYVVKRKPTGAKGNGKATVRELIAAMQAEQAKLPPWKRLITVDADELSKEQLAEAGLTLETVLDDGQWAALRPFTRDEWGGTLEDAMEGVHPDNEKLALDAARVLGLSMAGVDIMTNDITKPWYENGGIINEINVRPQFSIWGREFRKENLVSALVNEDGRIPVHLVTGEGDLLAKARQLKQELGRKGRPCHLTSAWLTEDEDGRDMAMEFSTLFDRSLALIMRPDVSEIVLAGSATELFERGLAVDLLESIHIVGDDPDRREGLLGELGLRFPVKTCQFADDVAA